MPECKEHRITPKSFSPDGKIVCAVCGEVLGVPVCSRSRCKNKISPKNKSRKWGFRFCSEKCYIYDALARSKRKHDKIKSPKIVDITGKLREYGKLLDEHNKLDHNNKYKSPLKCDVRECVERVGIIRWIKGPPVSLTHNDRCARIRRKRARK